MEGISLPKFLLLNKMSFLVLLPIYPLYRQAEDYSDYRFSESIHWSLYWKIYGPCSSSSGAKIWRYKAPFSMPDSLRVFRELNMFPEKLVVSSFRKARRKPPPGTCLAQGADFLFVCWGEALFIDKTSRSRTRSCRWAFLFVRYEFSRFKFLKDHFCEYSVLLSAKTDLHFSVLLHLEMKERRS